jgi:hypothetical protein
VTARQERRNLVTEQQKELVYRYTIGDQSWDIDWWDIEVDEFIAIKKATGYTYPVLAFEHENGDFEAAKALVWIARRRAGEITLAFEDVKLGKLRNFKREIVRRSPAAPDPQQPAAPVTASTPRKTSTTRSTSKRR